MARWRAALTHSGEGDEAAVLAAMGGGGAAGGGGGDGGGELLYAWGAKPPASSSSIQQHARAHQVRGKGVGKGYHLRIQSLYIGRHLSPAPGAHPAHGLALVGLLGAAASTRSTGLPAAGARALGDQSREDPSRGRGAGEFLRARKSASECKPRTPLNRSVFRAIGLTRGGGPFIYSMLDAAKSVIRAF